MEPVVSQCFIPRSSLSFWFQHVNRAAAVPFASKAHTLKQKPLWVQCSIKKQGSGSIWRETNIRCIKCKSTLTQINSPVIAEALTAALSRMFPCSLGFSQFLSSEMNASKQSTHTIKEKGKCCGLVTAVNSRVHSLHCPWNSFSKEFPILKWVSAVSIVLTSQPERSYLKVPVGTRSTSQIIFWVKKRIFSPESLISRTSISSSHTLLLKIKSRTNS